MGGAIQYNSNFQECEMQNRVLQNSNFDVELSEIVTEITPIQLLNGINNNIIIEETESIPEPLIETKPEINNENKTLSKQMIDILSCPISCNIMENPVITPDGNTFDKKYLLKWVNKNKNCPLTRQKLDISSLIPNKAIKICIDYYRKLNLLPKKIKNKKRKGLKKEDRNKGQKYINYEEERKDGDEDEDKDEDEDGDDEGEGEDEDDDEDDIQDNERLNILINSNIRFGNYYSGVLQPLDFPLNPDFTFITSNHYRGMIKSAYNTICILNDWEFIRRYTPNNDTGYLFDNDPRVQNILTHIDNNYGGHSGTSIGLTIRTMKKIASIGFEEFRTTYNN